MRFVLVAWLTVSVLVNGLQTRSRWRLPVADVEEDGKSAVIFPCHLHDLQPVLDQPVSMLVYYNQTWFTVPVYTCVYFLCLQTVVATWCRSLLLSFSTCYCTRAEHGAVTCIWLSSECGWTSGHRVYSVRLAPQCRAFSSSFHSDGIPLLLSYVMMMCM